VTVREWLARLGAALTPGRRDQREDDLASELRFHQQMLEDAHRARGLGPGAGPAALLITVGLAAHWLPIRKALRIDPASALRAE
jgi:hypothetical protein